MRPPRTLLARTSDTLWSRVWPPQETTASNRLRPGALADIFPKLAAPAVRCDLDAGRHGARVVAARSAWLARSSPFLLGRDVRWSFGFCDEGDLPFARYRCGEAIITMRVAGPTGIASGRASYAGPSRDEPRRAPNPPGDLSATPEDRAWRRSPSCQASGARGSQRPPSLAAPHRLDCISESGALLWARPASRSQSAWPCRSSGPFTVAGDGAVVGLLGALGDVESQRRVAARRPIAVRHRDKRAHEMGGAKGASEGYLHGVAIAPLRRARAFELESETWR